MCVTFIALNPSTDGERYKLIIVNNRDEYYLRPTSKLTWENGILAGRDEEDPTRGTWFGVVGRRCLISSRVENLFYSRTEEGE